MRGRLSAVGAVLVAGAVGFGSTKAGAAGSSPGMTGRFVAPDGAVVVRTRPTTADFAVSLTRDTGQCSGALSGRGKGFLSNTLTVSASDPASGTTCTVDLLYGADFMSVDVNESAACLVWHGAGCTFQGTYRRRR